MSKLLPHIQTTSREVEDKIIDEFIFRYAERFSHVNRTHYERFVRGVVGNMFSEEDIKLWMENSLPHLTTERLEQISQDPYFMLRESHPEEFFGYTPLAKWTQSESGEKERRDDLVRIFGEETGMIIYENLLPSNILEAIDLF